LKLNSPRKKSNEKDGNYRYRPNELYDYLVRQLFRDRLHQHDAYEICFAKRGQSDRTAAFQSALETARQRFAEKWGVVSSAPINVVACHSRDVVGLQAADYFLWALQRFYERGEHRYLEYLWPSFRLVRDLDGTKHYRYGNTTHKKSRSRWRPEKNCQGYRSLWALPEAHTAWSRV
jgi:hypothetical protein